MGASADNEKKYRLFRCQRADIAIAIPILALVGQPKDKPEPLSKEMGVVCFVCCSLSRLHMGNCKAFREILNDFVEKYCSMLISVLRITTTVCEPSE